MQAFLDLITWMCKEKVERSPSLFSCSDFSSTSGSSLQAAAMTEFWLISAPGEKTCQQTWDKLMVATTRPNNLSANNKFNIPDLKVRQNVTAGHQNLQVALHSSNSGVRLPPN